MKTEIKIIKAFLADRDKAYTILELAKKIGSDYRITHTAVRRLIDKNIIEKKSVGRATEIRLTKIFAEEVFMAEHGRREGLLKNNDFKVLEERLDSLPFLLIAMIFGSHAKGGATKKSDIDMMIICEKIREKEVESVISLIPLDIHPIILTHEEFLEMAKSREFSVVSESMKSNIILVGIEDYYRLIKDVR